MNRSTIALSLISGKCSSSVLWSNINKALPDLHLTWVHSGYKKTWGAVKNRINMSLYSASVGPVSVQICDNKIFT